MFGEFEFCEHGKCVQRDRWACGQDADWEDASGRAPWGDDTAAAKLAYLASMTLTEQSDLAEIAEHNLDTGWWQGVATRNGGWEDGGPWDQRQVQWRATARDYLNRRLADPAAGLTEGMLRYALYDLCRELAWLRNWCPGPP